MNIKFQPFLYILLTLFVETVVGMKSPVFEENDNSTIDHNSTIFHKTQEEEHDLSIKSATFGFKSNNSNPAICDFAPHGKCAGNMVRVNGSLSCPSQPLRRYTGLTEDECSFKCFNNSVCITALYLPKSITKRTRRCYLYDNRCYTPIPPNQIFFVWKCCQVPSVCSSVPGRCDGFWLRSNHSQHTMPGGPLMVQSGIQLNESLSECLASPVCGSINFQARPYSQLGSIEVNFNWPISKARNVSNRQWDWYNWLCCDIVDPTGKKCLNIPTKPYPGYWNLEFYATPPDVAVNYVKQFYTLNVTECLYECLQDSLCWKPWYSQNSSLCLLQAETYSTFSKSCSGSLKTEEYVNMSVWKWTKCSEGIIKSPLNDTKQQNVSKCMCLFKEQDVTLVDDNCDEPMLSSKRNSIHGLAFTATNKTLRREGKLWNRAFNGYEYFWWSALTPDAVDACASSELCDLYSGAPFKAPVTCPDVVSRGQWFSRPLEPRGKPFPTDTPLSVVMVTSTHSPSCPSYTKACSADYVRGLQVEDIQRNKFTDITSNFLIGSDGGVYEGLGWRFQPSLPSHEWNNRTLLITFLGQYEYETPSRQAVDVLKHLIQCAVHRSLLSEANYELLTPRDVNSNSNSGWHGNGTLLPGIRLYGILNNWPRYKGFSHLPTACGFGVWKIVVPSVLGSIALLALLVGLVYMIVVRCQRSSRRTTFRDCIELRFRESTDHEEDREAFI